MEQIQFIGTTPEALITLIAEVVSESLNDLKKDFQTKEPEQYLTRKKVAERLEINLSTLHNWTVKGTLTAYQIGGRVYYKQNEVENSLIKLKK